MLGSVRVASMFSIALIGAFAAGYSFPNWKSPEEGAIVTGLGKAIDGDSILVGKGKAAVDVRLYGIDAPEHDQECMTSSGENWACGARAAEELSKLVDGRQVRCEVITLEKSGAHRPIALCFENRVNVSEEMMRNGLGWAFERYLQDRPNMLARFRLLQEEAKKQSIGVWDGIAQAPWEYRANRWERYRVKSPNGCPIIGNINAKGEKIYHTPWSSHYVRMFDRLIASGDPNKEWLCDEREAVLKGYRPAHAR